MREPMAWVGVALTLGVALGGASAPDPDGALVGAALLAAVAVMARGARCAPWAVVAGALLFGVARGSPPAPPAAPPERRIIGVVRLTSGWSAWVDSDVGPLALDFAGPPPRPGVEIAAWIRAARPRSHLPGAFDFDAAARAAGRARRGVRAWVALGAAPEPLDLPATAGLRHPGLLRALVSGRRDHAPEATVTLLTRTGTRHLLAISGLHIGLVSAAVWAATRWLAAPLSMLRAPRLPRLLAAAAAIAAACAYAGAVGWPVSARRAAMMVAAAALARALSRGVRTASALGLAAGGVSVIEPAMVRTASFLLSFGAVAGMLVITPRITRLLPPDLPAPARWVATSFAATLGAQAGTLPITAWVFQQVPPLAPVANLVAAPLLGAVAVPAALAAAVAPPMLAQPALWVADLAAHVALSALSLLDRAPWAVAVGPVGALGLAGALLARRHPPVLAGLMAVALVAPAGLGPSGRLTATFLAVGQGDGALVELPDGRRWLVDGGPPSDQVLAWLRRRRIRRLDAVALSHPHPDHMGGLQPVLEHIEVGALWVPRPPEPGEAAYLALWRTAFRRGVPIRMPPDRPGRDIDLLHPIGGFSGTTRRRVNDESLVLRFTHGARSVLFTGDVEAQAEAWLAPDLDPVDVVKVPHHGSRSSSSSALVAALHPSVAVFSCGSESRFGHPHPEALAAWRGAVWLRTDRDGTVQVSTDGRDLRVRRWRPGVGWRGLRRRPWRPLPPPGD